MSGFVGAGNVLGVKVVGHCSGKVVPKSSMFDVAQGPTHNALQCWKPDYDWFTYTVDWFIEQVKL